MFTLIVKIADVGDRLGQYIQNRNASDSSDHVVKIADRLGWGVHTGRKNPKTSEDCKNPRFLRFLGQVGEPGLKQTFRIYRSVKYLFSYAVSLPI